MKKSDLLKATIVACTFLLTFVILVIDANIFVMGTKSTASAYILFIALVVKNIE